MTESLVNRSRLAELVEPIKGYLAARLSEPSVVEDLVQEILIKSIEALDSGQKIDHLGAWMFQVARTTLADYYRSKAKQVELDSVLDDDDTFHHQQLAACLMPFISELPKKYGLAITAEINGTSYRALADEEGVSISAIKSRAARARAMLKEKLLACCYIEIDNGMVSEYRRKI
ncbi:MAG: sigma-70 family RNA polymerase sigma factor [Gammaproteobacteria bacterium]|nr:sigma-70 family RNA polymerase sigma factor [Gammaproteobacteria bacterium]